MGMTLECVEKEGGEHWTGAGSVQRRLRGGVRPRSGCRRLPLGGALTRVRRGQAQAHRFSSVLVVAGGSWRPEGEITQYAGVGRFFGVYPVRGRASCVAVLPESEVHPNGWGDSTEERRALLRGRFDGFGGESLRPILDRLGGAERIDQVEVADLRVPEWRKGRVVLPGDAAATLLPSVGAGAATAMESAAVLNDELSRADAEHLSGALALYEKRRRKPVAGLQDGSRSMFRMATTRRATLARVRDAAFRVVPENMMMRDVERSLERPI